MTEARGVRRQLSAESSEARDAAGQARRAADTAGDESYAGLRYESRYEAHPVHGSLVRNTLTLGVERHVAALEFTLCLAVTLGVGLSFPALCLVAVVVLVIHPTLVWVTARDPLATEVYMRSRSYADYYAPHSSAQAVFYKRALRPRPSLPKAR